MKPEDLYIRSYRGEDGFNEYVSALGGDPVSVTQASGLAPSLPEGLINFESFTGTCRLYEEAAAQTGEPYFGLKWALHQPPDFRFGGPVIFLLTQATNIRHWLDMAIDYHKIHNNGIAYHYEPDKAANIVTGFISPHPLAPPCRQLLEHILAAVALLRQDFTPDKKFIRVTFQHSAPEDMTLYEEIFQCPVIFNADKTTIVAEYGIIGDNHAGFMTKLTSSFVKKYLDWQITKYPKTKQTISMLVTETIPVIIGLDGTDIQHVAKALNLHPKKLQRLLKEEGTSYSAILDEVRQNIAARLLVESDISINRLAQMLDYSSDRPFTTASKRWFGMSAKEYRKFLNS